MGYPVLLLTAVMRIKVIQIIQLNCDIFNNNSFPLASLGRPDTQAKTTRFIEVLLPWQRDVMTSLKIRSKITCLF